MAVWRDGNCHRCWLAWLPSSHYWGKPLTLHTHRAVHSSVSVMDLLALGYSTYCTVFAISSKYSFTSDLSMKGFVKILFPLEVRCRYNVESCNLHRTLIMQNIMRVIGEFSFSQQSNIQVWNREAICKPILILHVQLHGSTSGWVGRWNREAGWGAWRSNEWWGWREGVRCWQWWFCWSS